MVQCILLASSNAKKLAELHALCADLPLEILSPADLPGGLPDVVEDGDSFVANATKKALAAALVAKEKLGASAWALADDSGLCVDALHGAPGVLSARFALGEGQHGSIVEPRGSDNANNERLLRELDGVPEEQRGAAFHCVIVVAGMVDDAPKVLFMAEGSVGGRILSAADGDQGFGYDPLFWHAASGKSFARLSGARKALVSHRGQAVKQLKTLLQHHFDQEKW